MLKEIKRNTEKRMKSTMDDTHRKLATIRTGRASLAILDGVLLDYYGSETPLNQVAKLSIPDPTMIVAQPFDPNIIDNIEKAVLKAGLGLNPTNDGKMIRIPIPPLTEERRKQLVKKVSQIGEESKTAIRQIRRDSNDEIKGLEKEKHISQDEEHRGYEDVQKVTDDFIKKIEELVDHKTKEIMEG